MFSITCISLVAQYSDVKLSADQKYIAIIIGTGAGLSSRAGFYLSGESFIKFFDFKKKYNIHDMYLGSFYPYSKKQNIGLLCLVIYI